MPGNSFGHTFRITTFGESHGKGIGVVIDGCPAGLEVDEKLIRQDLQRRRPGQSSITSQRKEPEDYELLSGVFEGKTLGTPIAVLLSNKDAKPKDYAHLKNKFRPSHGDFTYQQKYGIRDYRGGGRSSARETALRVVAGAFAKMLLHQEGVQINGFVQQIGEISLDKSYQEVDLSKVEQNPVRCPDEKAAGQMVEHIKSVRKEGDTVGGTIQCAVQNMPTGWGEPVYDKMEADLAKAMLSINASKGFEVGSGFAGTKMRGSEHNDIFKNEEDKIVTETNYSGGTQGGISNGMDIYFNVAFKPVSTLMQDQPSVDKAGNPVTIKGKGRHDPCVVPRAVPIVEAMAAIVLADHYLRHRSSRL